MTIASRAAPIFLTLVVLVAAGCSGDEERQASGERMEVVLTEFELDPADISLDAPGTYTFVARNEGEIEHAFEVEGQGIEEETDNLAPGESAELTVELEAGEYKIYCPVGDHEERGMVGTLTVGGRGATETETGETETGGGGGY